MTRYLHKVAIKAAYDSIPPAIKLLEEFKKSFADFGVSDLADTALVYLNNRGKTSWSWPHWSLAKFSDRVWNARAFKIRYKQWLTRFVAALKTAQATNPWLDAKALLKPFLELQWEDVKVEDPLSVYAEAQDLPLVSLVVNNTLFQTGAAVTFPFARNTVSSKNWKIPQERFQQTIEPAGMYMIYDEDADSPKAPEGWIKGVMRFENPLVLNWGSGYNESSWKAHLHRKYGKTGLELSKALKEDGYDGIVTVSNKMLSEIAKL